MDNKKEASQIKKLEEKIEKLERAIVILTMGLCTCPDDERYMGGHYGMCRVREISELIKDQELKERAER